ncbi:hypothetical protein [Natrinema salifodinae]|uniref:Uncharacterized protein n=1 Tax=Natrinema salifodinae TaxID=1202768 RepID=A0A1I0Q2M5_9EURY|nr:hypothetical protein [Natrinema salifodinae]SEW21103.1 hypothetical protein SAMN05216285_2982 [Natrinema salifodinae]
MGAFSPNATDSPFELANWPFAGLAVLAGLTASVSVVATVTVASF